MFERDNSETLQKARYYHCKKWHPDAQWIKPKVIPAVRHLLPADKEGGWICPGPRCDYRLTREDVQAVLLKTANRQDQARWQSPQDGNEEMACRPSRGNAQIAERRHGEQTTRNLNRSAGQTVLHQFGPFNCAGFMRPRIIPTRSGNRKLSVTRGWRCQECIFCTRYARKVKTHRCGLLTVVRRWAQRDDAVCHPPRPAAVCRRDSFS